VADQTSRRLLEPPVALQPIAQLMRWSSRVETDPGTQWLRRRIAAFAQERDAVDR
jgi:hypothetical protein